MINLNNTRRAVAATLLAVMLTGCGDGIPIVSEVRANQGYTDSQTMILIATEKNRYQNVYTDQIWQTTVDKDGTTFQTYLLGEIRNFLAELKSMNLLADEKDISLTGQEKEKLKELSAVFYNSLTEADIAYMGVKESDVYTMYEEYHRANKLVDELTQDVNLEISDSEAKVISIQEIKLSDEAQAQDIYGRVTAEGADFAAIARSCSEDGEIEKQIGRSERKKEYEDVVFQLSSDEISPVFSYEGAYYIVKCVNDYNEEATLSRKQQLSKQRKNQAFRQIYDQHATEHAVEIQGSIWDEVSFISGDKSSTTSFFELYQEYMNQ